MTEKGRDAALGVWRRYKKSSSVETRNQLVEMYLPLVKCIAERVRSKLPSSVQLEDLMSAGVFGLMDAITRYDLDRDVKFETYCSTRIRGAILDELRKLDWVPRLVRSSAHQIEGVSRDLQSKLGRLPSREEVAEAMGLSKERFEDLVNSATAVTMVPFSSKFAYGDDDRHEQGAEIIRDESGVDPVKSLQKSELREVITNGLSEKEKMVIILYYFEELTLKEIGAILELSESRVCQIHSEVLVRLKGMLGPRKQDIWVDN